MTNIMLVEDNLIMRAALRDLLRLQGYNVVTAVHGREALDRLGESAVDLLVTDFLMPEMDGLILLQNLRSDERYQSLPVIMFTAHVDPEIQKNVMAAGANDFLVRPITIDELVAAIQRVLDV